MRGGRIILYMGTTGSGKTYKFTEHLQQEDSNVILFDTMADEKLARFGILVDSAADMTVLATKETQSKKFHIRIQSDDTVIFDHACQLAMKLGNVRIAVDELSMFCNSNYMPPEFKKLVRLGRHKNAGLMATTQRPPDIQALIISQCQEMYLFQMHLPNDVRYLSQFVPDTDRLLNLKRGQFILWNPQSQPNPSEQSPSQPEPAEAPKPLTSQSPSEPSEPTA
jgi:hypothetical protein